jgi:uncharacterized protein (TIGR02453 family)
MFNSFPREGLRFLRDLEKNNNREWFHSHKNVYEQHVKAPMEALVRAVNDEIRSFASAYVIEPKAAIARINRDTRFSKDKSPYKTEISAVFPCRGKEKHEAAGFYFGVSPKGVDVVGGAYMPGPEQLARIRAYVGAKHSEFRKTVEAGPLRDAMGELLGERLQRVPKDFPADHPARDFLRQKQFYYRTRLAPDVATSPHLPSELAKRFRLMNPFVTLLDQALGN